MLQLGRFWFNYNNCGISNQKIYILEYQIKFSIIKQGLKRTISYLNNILFSRNKSH